MRSSKRNDARGRGRQGQGNVASEAACSGFHSRNSASRSWRLVLLCWCLGGIALSGCDDDSSEPLPDAGGDVGPAASFTMDPSCTDSITTEVTFTSTATAAGGGLLSCEWTFAGGSPGTASTCVVEGVRFAGQTPSQVSLTVTDEAGNRDTASMAIGPC